MNESMKRWLRALAIALTIFFLLSLYLYLRRGYYNIYIINKVLGSSAVILAGLTLLIGPLRRFPFVISLMAMRRHIGLIAFALALLHIFFSLYQAERFVWFSWYFEEWIPVVFGIIAIATWGYMAYISRNSQIQKLGVDIWKRRLSIFGQLAFVALFLHLTIMKLPGWLRFFQGQVRQTPELLNPSYPPASMFVFLIMLVVIFYRIYVLYKDRKKNSEEEV